MGDRGALQCRELKDLFGTPVGAGVGERTPSN
jgi:hypothetical protein